MVSSFFSEKKMNFVCKNYPCHLYMWMRGSFASIFWVVQAYPHTSIPPHPTPSHSLFLLFSIGASSQKFLFKWGLLFGVLRFIFASVKQVLDKSDYFILFSKKSVDFFIEEIDLLVSFILKIGIFLLVKVLKLYLLLFEIKFGLFCKKWFQKFYW